MDDTVAAPRGSECHFASEGDIVGKFMQLACHTVPAAAAERFVERLLIRERLKRGAEVVKALALVPPAECA